MAFLLSLGIIFVAELGDKTQLMALCFATRHGARVVLAAIVLSTLVEYGLAVMLGGSICRLLSPSWIALLAGMAFIAFGFWTLRSDESEDPDCGKEGSRTPFHALIGTFFLAELGDKTMLTTIVLAARYPAVLVWLGATMGVALCNGLAIMAGQTLGAHLPAKTIRLSASVVFFAAGAVSSVEGARGLSPAAWGAGIAMLPVFGAVFLRQPKQAASSDGQGDQHS